MSTPHRHPVPQQLRPVAPLERHRRLHSPRSAWPQAPLARPPLRSSSAIALILFTSSIVFRSGTDCRSGLAHLLLLNLGYNSVFLGSCLRGPASQIARTSLIGRRTFNRESGGRIQMLSKNRSFRPSLAVIFLTAALAVLPSSASADPSKPDTSAPHQVSDPCEVQPGNGITPTGHFVRSITEDVAVVVL